MCFTDLFRRTSSFYFLVFILSIGCQGKHETNITGSSNDISGKYYREYKEPHGSYYLNIRDTIIVIKKDRSYEIQNHQWFISSDKPNEPYFRVPGFPTYQGTFNEIDTSISRERGGSIKFDLQKQLLYNADHPEIHYFKDK